LKNGIKRNGVCIKACVLMWIVLPVFLLCVSISSAEASNCTCIQAAGTGLEQITVTDSEIHALENSWTDSEPKSDSENSIAGQYNIEIDLYPTSEDNNDAKESDGAVKSESGSSNLVEKTSENNNENPESEGVDHEINSGTGTDINTDNPKSTVLNSDQETKAGSNNIKSANQNELSLEQKTTVKSNTAATESTGTSLKQKTGTDVSKETKSSGNQEVVAKLEAGTGIFNVVKSSTSEGVKPVPKTNGAQKELCSCATTTPQKTDNNLDSSSTNLSSDSSSTNLSSNSSSMNLSSNSSSMNLSSNSSSMNLSSDLNSTDSESDLNSINSASDPSSMDSESDSGGPSYGSAHVIKNTELSTPVIEKSKPDVDVAEALGIKDIQPKIEGQQPKIEGQQPKIEGQKAQASVISHSSDIGSFSIGLLGAFIIVFIILLTLLI